MSKWQESGEKGTNKQGKYKIYSKMGELNPTMSQKRHTKNIRTQEVEGKRIEKDTPHKQ